MSGQQLYEVKQMETLKRYSKVSHEGWLKEKWKESVRECEVCGFKLNVPERESIKREREREWERSEEQEEWRRGKKKDKKK